MAIRGTSMWLFIRRDFNVAIRRDFNVAIRRDFNVAIKGGLAYM